jgi:hypothetical protein
MNRQAALSIKMRTKGEVSWWEGVIAPGQFEQSIIFDITRGKSTFVSDRDSRAVNWREEQGRSGARVTRSCSYFGGIRCMNVRSWVSGDQMIVFTQSWHRGVYPILTQGGSDKLRSGSVSRDRISSMNYNEWTSDVDHVIASLPDCSWVSADQLIMFTQSWHRGVYPILTQGGSDKLRSGSGSRDTDERTRKEDHMIASWPDRVLTRSLLG